ncbi:hypothetical protein NDN08_001106 [Rhodosorus marinus]|uniref:Uncharacterized protein n=1 Tax=Rhodosorus marinus TaxID=101924 RepID=A0AAV8USM1_9RHOD|nr:hypothetical protein NDN08_001106 [Rhodosorus marinus]
MAFVGATGFSSSFVSRSAVSKRPARAAIKPVRMTMDVEVANKVMDVFMTVASKESDWGGYTGPVVGLLTIVTLIAILSPPLKD